MEIQNYLFILFSVVIVGFLIADLGFFNKTNHRIKPKTALFQSLFWIAISVSFSFLIFLFINKEAAAEFLSAYVNF